MEALWASWRSKYIQGFKDEIKNPNTKDCFICDAGNSIGKDKELLVVFRGKSCFVMMNKFPYNGGHVLVSPYRHIGNLDELNDTEMLELMHLARETTKALKVIGNPHGYNIGINLGRVAGAGLPEHIHIHVVPRWLGDTSYMSVLADTKVVSQSLEEIQMVLYEAFKKINK